MTAGSDAFADAPLLDPVQNAAVHEVGSSATATTEGGEYLGFGTLVDRTRWLKFVAPVDGRFTVQLLDVFGPWRRVALFGGDGSMPDGADQLAVFWSPDERTGTLGTMLAGETYWLQVGTEVGDADDVYRLALTFERLVRVTTEWDQLDDIAREVIDRDSFLPGARTNRYGNFEADVPGLFDPDLFTGGLLGVLTRTSMTRNDAGPFSYSGLVNAEYDVDTFGEDHTEYQMWGTIWARYFSAWDHREPPAVTVPDGWTGVEWENGTGLCDVLGGTLHTEVGNFSKDESPTPDTPVIGGNWYTKFIAATGVVWELPESTDEIDAVSEHNMANEAGAVLATYGPGRVMPEDGTWEPVAWDVSPHLDEYGHLVLIAAIDYDTFDPPEPQFQGSSVSPGLALGADFLTPYIDMTMRPARHRFYRDEWSPYLAPPLRKHPRDDGQALSGTRRGTSTRGARSVRIIGRMP